MHGGRGMVVSTRDIKAGMGTDMGMDEIWIPTGKLVYIFCYNVQK